MKAAPNTARDAAFRSFMHMATQQPVPLGDDLDFTQKLAAPEAWAQLDPEERCLIDTVAMRALANVSRAMKRGMTVAAACRHVDMLMSVNTREH